jgi:BirA family biotin operon repressor/biotin-[acetyl-CoA-carboxylase] ligase
MSDATLDVWEGRSVLEWRERWQCGEVRAFTSIGSTNDVVAQMARAGAPTLSLALAEVQTHGRGRSGARWHAPEGSALLFSVLFRIEQQGTAPTCAPVRVGLAVAEAVQELAGVETRVKWPNDVVINGCGKVAGVLCEAVFGAEGAQIVAGVGINVKQRAEEFPADLHGQACSIASASGLEVSRAELLTAIMLRLHAFAEHITEPFNGDELKRIAMRDVLRDQQIVCDDAGQHFEGHARGIASDGALLVQQDSFMRAIYNGTVRLAQSNAYPGGGKA